MATTLKQIAEILNLDYSTVSYALSGKGSINEATRQRVREAADQLGYIPNGLARRMRSTKSHAIGIVLPDTILNYNEIIQQLYRGAALRGYESQIALTEFDEQAEDRAIRSFLEARTDAILVRSRYGEWDLVPQGAALRQAAAQKIPIVIYGKDLSGSPFPALALPLSARSSKAMAYLLQLGHAHVGILLPVMGPTHYPHVSMIEGVQQALATARTEGARYTVWDLKGNDLKLDSDGSFDEYGNYLDETLPRRALLRGRSLMREAMRSPSPPTAFIAYNEITATGAYLEARDLGLDVPGQASIVSVTRGLAAELAPVPLTTCDVLPRDVAEASLDLLIEAMSAPTSPPTVATVEPVLVIGATSGPQKA